MTRGYYQRHKTVNKNTRRESPIHDNNQQTSGAGTIDLNTSNNYIAPTKDKVKSRGLGARILITKNDRNLNLHNF